MSYRASRAKTRLETILPSLRRAVNMKQMSTDQAFKTLGNGGRESLFSGQLRDEEYVLRRTHLIGPMSTTFTRHRAH